MVAPIIDSSADRTEKYEWHNILHILVALKSPNRSSFTDYPHKLCSNLTPTMMWCRTMDYKVL